MPALPVISGREATSALAKAGFRQVRQRGSHVVLQKSLNEGTRTVVVPDHSELAKGTLRSIIRQAGLSPEEFLSLLR